MEVGEPLFANEKRENNLTTDQLQKKKVKKDYIQSLTSKIYKELLCALCEHIIFVNEAELGKYYAVMLVALVAPVPPGIYLVTRSYSMLVPERHGAESTRRPTTACHFGE